MRTGIVTTALIFVASLACACSSDDDEKPAPSEGGTGGTTGWKAAVGDEGAFVQTFDDVSWHERTLTNKDLHAVACVGNNDGWAVGEAGYVARTRDSGETWSEQQVNTDKTLRAVRVTGQFSGAQGKFIGIVAGDDGTIAVTDTGGDTWRLVSTSTKSTLRSVALSHGGQLMLAVGDAGAVVRSKDRGNTFTSAVIPGAGDLYGVAMDTSGGLILAVDLSGSVWASRDLGLSFDKERSYDQGLRAVALSHDGKHAVVSGNAGLIGEYDAASGWRLTPAQTQQDLHAALISHDGKRKYVAGASGALLTGDVDPGHWTPVSLKGTVTLRGMEDLDPR